MNPTALLAFLLLSWTALAQPKPPFRIVHLGDSFSAGNGARNNRGRPDYFSVPGCFRSPSNWGQRFADSLTDVFSVFYINRACSGGVLDHITNPRDVSSFFSPLIRLDGSCPDPDHPGEEFFVRSLLRCKRFLRPQIEAVDTTVDLVILTIGGNDAGFASIITHCLARPRFVDDCRDAVRNANMVLNTFAVRLANLFATIRARMKPEARIVLVTYPHLILNTPYQIRFFANTFDAGTAIRTLGNSADEVQRTAVNQANAAAGENYVVLFDRTKTVFAGRESDPSANARNPNRWIIEFEGLEPREWYHPNQLGHEMWGTAISTLETFGSVGGSFETGGNVDLVFVVDTTGSMGGEIAQVRTDLRALVNELSSTSTSFRVAVIAYRDFPERTGSSTDFPAQVVQTFTSSLSSIQAAIDSLDARGGGDFAESVLSGINAANGLPWRPGVTKTAVVIGDAPPLIEGGAEPFSGLTPAQVVADSIAVDPVRVLGVNVGSLTSPALSTIVDGTGGVIINGAANLTRTLLDVIDDTAALPFATFGIAVSGRVGEPVLFNAQGSFDPRGRPIDTYEWDFDGDGTFDVNTTEPQIENTYDTAFTGFVILRVTSGEVSALASARTVINDEGFVSQGDGAPCEVDEDGTPTLLTEAGAFNNTCTLLILPTSDPPGFTEITDDVDEEALNEALDALDAAVARTSRRFRSLARRIRTTALARRLLTACRLLRQLRLRATSNRSLRDRRRDCALSGCVLEARFPRVVAAVILVEEAVGCGGNPAT